MELFDMIKFAAYTDLTNVSIDLPEELGNDVLQFFTDAYELSEKIAAHLYGDDYTDEQVREVPLLMLMWMRKQIQAASSDS